MQFISASHPQIHIAFHVWTFMFEELLYTIPLPTEPAIRHTFPYRKKLFKPPQIQIKSNYYYI